MKKLLLAASAVSLVAVGTASAENSNLRFRLQADVDTRCGVFAPDNGDVTGPLNVDFGDLTEVSATTSVRGSGNSGGGDREDVIYVCNSPDGFNRTITSDNSGFLLRNNSSGDEFNRIRYRMRHFNSSDASLDFPLTQLDADIVNTTALGGLANTDFLSGVASRIRFRADGVNLDDPDVDFFSTEVFAGRYRDIVRVQINAI